MEEYYNIFKNRDEKYNTDWTQMDKIDGIKAASDHYWLASRGITIGYAGGMNYTFGVNIVYNSDILTTVTQASVALINEDRGLLSTSVPYGFRSVFTLKSEIKITEGDGVNTPYKLEV